MSWHMCGDQDSSVEDFHLHMVLGMGLRSAHLHSKCLYQQPSYQARPGIQSSHFCKSQSGRTTQHWAGYLGS